MFKQAITTLLLMLATTVASFAAAPVPDAAKGVQIAPDKGYYVKEIADGLYWLTEGAYTTMFLTTGEGVIVVDAPPTIGDKLLKAIAEVTDEPITHVIYSHSHADHIAAAGLVCRRFSRAAADPYLRGQLHAEGRKPDARTRLSGR
jgi:glyoxylase-like metal-dependent hydrolase (beta-lactamase superfamily II)